MNSHTEIKRRDLSNTGKEICSGGSQQEEINKKKNLQ
jgi:hypothetical protein